MWIYGILLLAFLILLGGMIYYAFHLKRLYKKEQDDFENARHLDEEAEDKQKRE